MSFADPSCCGASHVHHLTFLNNLLDEWITNTEEHTHFLRSVNLDIKWSGTVGEQSLDLDAPFQRTINRVLHHEEINIAILPGCADRMRTEQNDSVGIVSLDKPLNDLIESCQHESHITQSLSRHRSNHTCLPTLFANPPLPP